MSERARPRSNFNYNEAQKNVSNQRQGAIISITINGERREVPAGLNIRNLVEHLGLDPQRVAVELNRRLVRRPDWETTPVEEGASLEIVTFVGGG